MLELDRTEEVIREMDKLANEDHPHCHRRRTQRIPWQLVDTFEFCGFRHDAYKASSRLQTSVDIASNKQRMKLITKIGGKALPHRGGNDKIPSDILHLRHHHDDGLDTDRRGNLRKSVNRLFTCGMSFTMNLVHKLQ